MRIIITGPGGSGKSTLVENISKVLCIKKVISTTSRAIRVNEVDHVDYHFISKREFKMKIEQNYFLESVYIYDNYYGTAHTDYNEDFVATLTLDKAEFVKSLFSDVLIIFLKCSCDICKKRLMLRENKTNDDCGINMRVNEDQVLYSKIPDNCFLVDASRLRDEVLQETIHIIKYVYYKDTY